LVGLVYGRKSREILWVYLEDNYLMGKCKKRKGII